MLTPVNPPARRVDFGVRLNRGHDGRCRNVDLSGFLDYSLKCGAHVALALGKKVKGMGMTVDAGPISKAVLLRDGARAASRHKVGLNFGALRMRADRAVAFVPAQAYLSLPSHFGASVP